MNPPDDQHLGATQRVYVGLLSDLETHRMVPGQRLVEGDLANRFGVGRNAVREALQRLSVRGIVDLSRHRSAAIRSLDLAEALEVLEVASWVGALLCRLAAERFDQAANTRVLIEATKALDSLSVDFDSEAFGRARRAYYRALIATARNRELERLFPAIGMHIVYLQYQTATLMKVRVRDYRSILDAVQRNDVDAAERAGVAHVSTVREAILAQAQGAAENSFTPRLGRHVAS